MWIDQNVTIGMRLTVMNSRFGSLMIMFGICVAVQCQQRSIEKGNKYYDELGFYSAVLEYERAFAKGATDETAMRRLATCYSTLRDFESAEMWWARLSTDPDAMAPDLYNYAIALRNNGKYDESDKWIGRYAEITQDERAIRFMNSQQELRSLLTDGLFQAQMKPLSSNTISADLAPAILGNGLVFASSRKSQMSFKKVHALDGKVFLDLYTGERTPGGDVPELKPLSLSVNSEYHDSNPAFSADGNTLWLSRNGQNGSTVLRNENGVNNIQLYHADRDGKGWTTPVPFKYNDVNWSTGQAAESSDGKLLIFVSDRPGGFGGTDLYYCERMETGDWSEPKNLGAGVNSQGNEMTPYVHKDGTLFFSSDGHFGIGGMDLFMCTMNGTEANEVFNLGAPINSRYDELSLNMDTSGSFGYLSSNRPGGAGDDDVYRFDLQEPYDAETFFNERYAEEGQEQGETEEGVFTMLRKLAIRVVDGVDGSPIEEVELIYDEDVLSGAKVIQGRSDQNGQIALSLPVDLGVKKSILLQHEDYLPKSIELNEFSFATDGDLDYLTVEMFEKGKGIDLTQAIGLENIHFDFESWTIRTDAAKQLDRVVHVMNTYPDIRIELISHTDARGSTGYNDVLSALRANASEEYLLSKGVDPSRLSSRGMGETKPVNHCIDGAKCSEEDHQLNRRTEFIVR